ncbi:DUF4387 family protein [Variovorax sp. J22P168]|uniref:DUF4387 family protein n=1 Tax=Variovorax jilinensis TaxID=3053513 RepID=UPI0025787944|nr:DUF4387 family protein [Variovorax sp. J22P168]MDM0014563.1 DUF4387 family protein [Variovorax sp. J22P168]
MSKLVYRVVSACGALGYGFPRESLQEAIKGRVDAIVSDAGSMDAGPYFLGTGTEYFEREAVKADFRHMVEAGLQTGAPVILGSCGMAGGNRNLDWMLDVAKEVFAELKVGDAKVAVIHSELAPEVVIGELRRGALRPTGLGPELDEEALRQSTIVGQMGIHPLITALESGARYIFAGRACDIALFASDMVRRGIDAGIAYHVGHVLECGALACDPGSPSDCLVAEVYDDGSAVFVAPNPDRRCTPYSIAAHSLYEESHPQLQFYPEGVLVMDKTEFFARDARSAGIRNSRFVHAGKPWPLSIKLEGARRLGARKVSLIHIDAAELPKVPAEVLVYGRNGVQAAPVQEGERELGIIVETTAATLEAAETLASLLTHYLIHYGYPGRKATAGNIAYPLSPNLVSFQREDGRFGAIVPSGTRDPVFFANYEKVKAAVIGLIEAEFPEALANAQYRIIDADEQSPAILLRTIDTDPARLAERHAAEVEAITRLVTPKPGSHIGRDAADAYAWSLYHLLQNEEVITNTMFPITYFRAEGAQWVEEGKDRPRYFDIGIRDETANLDDRTLSLIADAPPRGEPHSMQRLLDMAVVIRSKDAGINRLTFDIVFNSAADYEAALRSNVFYKDHVAATLGVAPERVVGSFFVDTCNAIKISIDRPNISASPDERDVFGAQQQSRIESLRVPVFIQPLASASTL